MVSTLVGLIVIASLAGLALWVGTTRRFSGLAFTCWVCTVVAAALLYPSAFISWGGYTLTNLIVPLIQIIMFGMGTTLSVADFGRVLVMPRAALIGIVLQFVIMPLTALTLASLFGFEGEVGAGIILVGAAPGGVASNVMTYLAGGNVALSVTMTAVSTLLSPIMTPLAMQTLAGRFVPIDFYEMMMSILYMIILPIVAGLVVNSLLRGRQWIHRILPIVSMVAICIILAIITASSRDALLAVAVALFTVVVLHNAIGFLFGYWGGRLFGLDEANSRTASIEVGMQNAGMASGLAISVLHSTDAGLAAAIFGPWMNVTGSILASFWRQRSAR
ncbi:MAG: bile acid:sodium symporter family protein [Luteitalea sp.]|nr:bile acid:sodium symporter family protein [Luteitalea sp.]